jgi:hypothetical protein
VGGAQRLLDVGLAFFHSRYFCASKHGSVYDSRYMFHVTNLTPRE